MIVNSIQRQKITGRYTLRILVPDTMRGDATNRIKPIEDLLVQMGVTPDDRYNKDGSAGRDVNVMPGTCIVIIEDANQTEKI